MPQMLECYLQLAGRAGERQRSGVSVGVACHSSPHYGGAVAYSAEPFDDGARTTAPPGIDCVSPAPVPR